MQLYDNGSILFRFHCTGMTSDKLSIVNCLHKSKAAGCGSRILGKRKITNTVFDWFLLTYQSTQTLKLNILMFIILVLPVENSLTYVLIGQLIRERCSTYDGPKRAFFGLGTILCWPNDQVCLLLRATYIQCSY